MAGIGFVLRRLSRQDSLLGVAQALFFSTLVAAGPWLVTIVVLGALTFFMGREQDSALLEAFRPIIIYNFQFSLLLVSPITIIATRYMADCLYRREPDKIVDLIVGGSVLLVAILMPIATIFYFVIAGLPIAQGALGMVNFLMLGILWLLSVFVSATRDYLFISLSFLTGFGLALVLAIAGGRVYGVEGILLGMTVGIGVTVGALLARITANFRSAPRRPFAFLTYFTRYWELAVGSFAFTLATWIDKWIMWSAPEASHGPAGFVFYPGYENAMFLASLSSLPVFGLFLMSVETGFYERCRAYHAAIGQHASLDEIGALQQSITTSILQSLRNLAVLQGILSAILIFLAPQLFDLLGLNFVDVGIFRFAVCGMFFFVFLLFATVLLTYFDARRAACGVQVFYLGINAIASYISLQLGPNYYGYGFFFASVLACGMAVLVFARVLNVLPYLTFVVNNAQLRRSS